MTELEALVETLRKESRMLLARLPLMPLSDIGRERVMCLLQRFLTSTEADLAAARTDKFLLDAVIDIVEERIDDLRKLEEAQLSAIRSVRDAEWLLEAMRQAPGVVESVMPRLMSSTNKKTYLV